MRISNKTLLILLICCGCNNCLNICIGATSFEPFNAKKLLPTETTTGGREFDMLGPIKILGSNQDLAYYFDCLFEIHTRTNIVNDIKLEKIEYKTTIFLKEGDSIAKVKTIKSEAEHFFNLTKLQKSSFDPLKRTIIIIPGYLSSDQDKSVEEIKNYWLKLEDVNVIKVSWKKGNTCLYSTAVANVKLVARQITMLLYYLANTKGSNFNDEKYRSNIHLVGHSLGAHVAGHVGLELGGQVGRITGLDPAGPIFDQFKREDSLDKSDAKFVDAIHTNSGKMRYYKLCIGCVKKAKNVLLDKLWIFGSDEEKQPNLLDLAKNSVNQTSALDSLHAPWYGIDKRIGHMDYFANGGSLQPGCNDPLHICDHGRAFEIYVKALEFELKAREEYGPTSKIIQFGDHRLIAFPATNYDQFKTGASLLVNCKETLDSPSISNGFKRCTVPMDFVSDGEKIKKELEGEDYKIFLDDENENRKYYFDTLSEDPLVSDHYLLRIHLEQEVPANWKQNCRLFSMLHSSSGKKMYSQIEYQAKYSIPAQSDSNDKYFHGLVLPVVSPNDWRKVFPTLRNIFKNEQIMMSTSGGSSLAKTINQNDLNQFVPVKLLIGLFQNESSSSSGGLSYFKKAYEYITSFFTKTSRREGESTICGFTYNAFELIPFSLTMGEKFSLWFAAITPEIDQSQDKEEIFIVQQTNLEQVLRVLNVIRSTKFNLVGKEERFVLRVIGWNSLIV